MRTTEKIVLRNIKSIDLKIINSCSNVSHLVKLEAISIVKKCCAKKKGSD